MKLKEKYILPTILTSIVTISIISYISIFGVDGIISRKPNSPSQWSNFPLIRTIQPTIKITDPNHKLLFIGDVHGNYDEFIQLLKDHKYYKDGELISDPDKVHITLLGDFLTKGPDSLKIANFILKYKDQIGCVLGNNEIMVLLSLLNPNGRLKVPLKFTTEDNFLPDEENGYWDIITPRKKHYKVAKKIGLIKLTQLAQHCSIVKKFDLSLSNDILFGVHAGLLPGDFMTKEKNVIERIPKVISLVDMKYVNERNWNETGRNKDDVENGVRWYKIWDKYYKDESESKLNITVLYGHDAHNGLTLKEHTKGLDSGCANGGYLSSLEYSFDPKSGHYISQLHQVPCHRSK